MPPQAYPITNDISLGEMSVWEKITRSNFLIRVKSWEYWPFGIIQFPAILYWLFLSLRSRSLVFFSASNPGIPMGGMFGESKFEVLEKIPAQYIPRMLLVASSAEVSEVCKRIDAAGMMFPLIFKPDIGERGYLVRKVKDVDEIRDYLRSVKGNFIVQEFVDLSLEFGVYYMRDPSESRGRITSLVKKEMLSVTGDGISTLQQLIMRNDRAKLQWKKLRIDYLDRLQTVPLKSERIELVSIGNHAMGTKFIDASNLINDALSRTFDGISNQIPGFYFGRFDLRCASVEDLYCGNVKIMELNGCGAEPAHIYDPDFSLWEAVMVQLAHWTNIFRISRANKSRGVRYVTHKEAFKYYRRFKSVMK